MILTTPGAHFFSFSLRHLVHLPDILRKLLGVSCRAGKAAFYGLVYQVPNLSVHSQHHGLAQGKVGHDFGGNGCFKQVAFNQAADKDVGDIGILWNVFYLLEAFKIKLIA